MNQADFENLTLKLFPSIRPPRKSAVALGKVDYLIERIGIGIVQTVERYYKAYLDKPTPANAKKYVTWRLRLHRRVKNNREMLEAINDARNLGLHDERPGKTFWDCDFG